MPWETRLPKRHRMRPQCFYNCTGIMKRYKIKSCYSWHACTYHVLNSFILLISLFHMQSIFNNPYINLCLYGVYLARLLCSTSCPFPLQPHFLFSPTLLWKLGLGSTPTATICLWLQLEAAKGKSSWRWEGRRSTETGSSESLSFLCRNRGCCGLSAPSVPRSWILGG